MLYTPRTHPHQPTVKAVEICLRAFGITDIFEYSLEQACRLRYLLISLFLSHVSFFFNNAAYAFTHGHSPWNSALRAFRSYYPKSFDFVAMSAIF